MSQLTTFAPVASFEGSVCVERAQRSRVRGILSGLAFLGARVPFYVCAALLAAVVCCVGVTLYGLHASLGGRRA